MDQLNKLRKEIDMADKELLTALSKRFTSVKKIGELKKSQGLPPLDKKRWQKVLKSRLELGKNSGLSEKFIKKIYDVIHKYSLEIEVKI